MSVFESGSACARRRAKEKPGKQGHSAEPGAIRRMERAARFESLLEAAIKAMAERGVARAAHADVANLSGVSVPTVFFYFRTRPLLVEAVLAEIERFVFSVIEEGCREGGSARGMIRRILQIFVSHVETQPARIRVWLDWSTAVREDIWNQYVALQVRIIARFRELIASGKAVEDIASAADSDDAAHLLVGQGHMLVLMRLAGVDAKRVSHFIDHLVDSTIPPPRPHFSNFDAPTSPVVSFRKPLCRSARDRGSVREHRACPHRC